jgi:hypothetical protein
MHCGEREEGRGVNLGAGAGSDIRQTARQTISGYWAESGCSSLLLPNCVPSFSFPCLLRPRRIRPGGPAPRPRSFQLRKYSKLIMHRFLVSILAILTFALVLQAIPTADAQHVTRQLQPLLPRASLFQRRSPGMPLLQKNTN